MKQYLKIIENTSIVWMLIGCVGHRFLHFSWAIWMCIAGLIGWLGVVVFKAFNWQEYAKDNKQNILMMLFVIILMFILMLRL